MSLKVILQQGNLTGQSITENSHVDLRIIPMLSFKQSKHAAYSLGINFPFVQKMLTLSYKSQNLLQSFLPKQQSLHEHAKVSSSAPLTSQLQFFRQGGKCSECSLRLFPCCFLRVKKHAPVGELPARPHDPRGHDGLGMVHTQMGFQLLYRSIAS